MRSPEAVAVRACGALIFCIDFELSWGSAFRDAPPGDDERVRRGRERMVPLLDLFDAHRIPATWATVGHLFLDRCDATDGVPHPEMARPHYPWMHGDWFQHDPCADLDTAPLWYARDLVEEIRSRPAGHEIASHSFSHLLFGAPGCDRRAAEDDLAAAVRAAAALGIRTTSFVYPQHRRGHEDLLGPNGFTAFRGDLVEPFMGLPGLLRKPLRLGAQVLRVPPPPADARRDDPAGAVDLPASMHMALPAGRLGRLVSASALATRCERGIRRAAREGRMFQVFFHDHNAGVRGDEFLEAMDRVLGHAAALREQGRLEVSTMGTYAAGLTEAAGPR